MIESRMNKSRGKTQDGQPMTLHDGGGCSSVLPWQAFVLYSLCLVPYFCGGDRHARVGPAVSDVICNVLQMRLILLYWHRTRPLSAERRAHSGRCSVDLAQPWPRRRTEPRRSLSGAQCLTNIQPNTVIGC